MKPLGVGIIGCGTISTIYMQNMPSFAGIQLVGCSDIIPERSAAQAMRFNIAQLTNDELLARPDIDIVVNLTPPQVHHEIALATLRAGKHAFGEKPITVEPAHAAELVALAAERELKIGCAPDTFLGAGGRLAREILDSGRIGRVLSGTCFMMNHGMEHWHPDPEFFYQYGGGPVLDVGPYYLAALINLIGPVAEVRSLASTGFAERIVTTAGAKLGTRIAVETPTTLMALVRFVSGADIVFAMSWDVWKHGHPAIELYGTEGSLRVPDPNFYGGTVEYSERDGEWIGIDPAQKPFGRPNWRSPAWPASRPSQANYRCLGIAELARAVTQGAAQRASGALASHALEVMHAIINAGTGGGAIGVASRIERPPVLSDADAAALWDAAPE